MENDNNGEEIENEDNKFVEYDQFQHNDILHITCTEKNYFCLLKNGNLLSWGENTFSLGRKCKTSGNESAIPKEVEFKVKILDVVCGSEHILVRNVHMEVFSWGKNDFGQLGLVATSSKEFLERSEPCQIQYFQGIKIKQIFARNKVSFAITEEANNIYGWGRNTNKMISKTNSSEYIGLPTLIQLNNISLNELYFFIDGNSQYADLMEYKQIDLLKKEVKREEDLSKIMKTRKFDDVEKRIDDMRNYFIQNRNNYERTDFNMQVEKYKDIEKSYKDLIKSNEKKEDKNGKGEKSLEKAKPLTEVNKASDLKINLKNILEYLNEHLHNNKNMALKESNELKNKITQSEKERKKYNDYKLICDDVIKKAKVLLNSKPAETILNDLREVDSEVAKINSYIEENLIKNSKGEDNKNTSYRYMLSKTYENTSRLVNDLLDIKFDENLESAQQCKKILKSNIFYSKQNNLLLDKMFTLSNNFYTKFAMKDFVYIKPDPDAYKKANEARENHWKNALTEQKRREEENIRNEADGFINIDNNKN